jgi:hypothetical protein
VGAIRWASAYPTGTYVGDAIAILGRGEDAPRRGRADIRAPNKGSPQRRPANERHDRTQIGPEIEVRALDSRESKLGF